MCATTCSSCKFLPLPLSNTCFCLQHFVCAKCEKPFLGHRHYERKGLAYCETHYNQVRDHTNNGFRGHPVRYKVSKA